MKAVILAGGLGTRLSEETHLKPKPMVEIGGYPIIWHIMKIYHNFGITDFVVCCGYKGEIIKDFFLNYSSLTSDITVDLQNNRVELHKAGFEPWRVTLVDTGQDTMTGGRLLKVKKYLENSTFLLTYGDGVGNVDIRNTIDFHRSHRKLATMTVTNPPGRFGAVRLEGNKVEEFTEKPTENNGLINAGFFVLDADVFEYIKDDTTVFEQGPLKSLTEAGELMAYKHHGFWQPMDTMRDKKMLNELWATDQAPWKIWV